MFVVSVERNDLRWRSSHVAAAAEIEFTTYDVSHINMYTSDGQRLDTTEMMVITFCIVRRVPEITSDIITSSP